MYASDKKHSYPWVCQLCDYQPNQPWFARYPCEQCGSYAGDTGIPADWYCESCKYMVKGENIKCPKCAVHRDDGILKYQYRPYVIKRQNRNEQKKLAKKKEREMNENQNGQNINNQMNINNANNANNCDMNLLNGNYCVNQPSMISSGNMTNYNMTNYNMMPYNQMYQIIVVPMDYYYSMIATNSYNLMYNNTTAYVTNPMNCIRNTNADPMNGNTTITCSFHPDFIPLMVDLYNYFLTFGKITTKIRIEWVDWESKKAPIAQIKFDSAECVDKICNEGRDHMIPSSSDTRAVKIRVYRTEHYTHLINSKKYRQINSNYSKPYRQRQPKKDRQTNSNYSKKYTQINSNYSNYSKKYHQVTSNYSKKYTQINPNNSNYAKKWKKRK